MTQAEELRNHHFAPVYYLSRWAGSGGRIEQFTTPFAAEVKPHRMLPSATRFKPDFYATLGLPGHLVQQVSWAADRPQLGFVQRHFRTMAPPTLGDASIRSATSAP